MKNLSTELQLKLEDYKKTAETIKKELSREEISEIETAIKRLEELKLTISAFGETNAGKSALLNSLLGFNNQEPKNCPFAISANINKWDDEIEKNNSYTWKKIQGLEIIVQDTPGIAGDFKDHLDKAKKIAGSSDVILYIVSEAVKGELQRTAMKELLAAQKPLIVVINKVDIKKDYQIQATIADTLQGIPEINEDMIVKAAGDPMQGFPIVEELVNKITSLVEQQQDDLIRKTVEAKAEMGVKIAARRIQQKIKEQEELLRQKDAELADFKTKSENVINIYAIAAAASAGLIPFGIDAITSVLISSGMFKHIADIYKKDLDYKTTLLISKELVSAFVSILFVSAATLTAYITLRVAMKTNPITYLAGMALDFAFTYFIVFTIGQAFSFYCANDFTWGQKKTSAEVLKEFIKKNLYDMFIDKLPKQFRDRVLRLINPELLRR